MEKDKKKLTEKQVIRILMICIGVMLICVIGMFVCSMNLANDIKALQNENAEMQTQFDLERKELSEINKTLKSKK